MPTLPRVLVRVARRILPQLPDPLHHLLADVMPTSTALFQLLALLAQLVLPVLHLQLDPLKVPVLLEGLPHRAQRTPTDLIPRVLVHLVQRILKLLLDPFRNYRALAMLTFMALKLDALLALLDPPLHVDLVQEKHVVELIRNVH